MLKRILLLGASIVLTCVVYWAGLNGPLLFDDTQNLAPLSAWIHGRLGWESVVFGNTSGSFGRPVSMASFVLNVTLLGETIWALKFVNLLIHLFNGVLVYALFQGFLKRTSKLNEGNATWLPLLGASIWLLHPLLVSTVLYVVQRMAMLSATFTLLTMLAYLHGRIALDERRWRKAWTFLSLVPVATVLAALSKENGILAPALCGVIELFVFQPSHSGTARSRWSKAWIGTTLLVPAVIAIALTATQNRYVVVGYTNRPFTLVDRLLTQPRALWDYIGSLLLPYGPKLGLYHDDYPISHSLFQPHTTVLAILGWLVVVSLAWQWRRKIPGFALGVGIFIVGHALESTVFPLLMYFEHRNYLPAIGAIWATLSLIQFAAGKLRPHMHHANAIFITAGTCLVLALALATGARAAIWSSLPTMLAQDLINHPDSTWLRIAAAGWALDQQPPKPDLARQHLGHLLKSADRGTQRMGAAATLIVDCTDGLDAKPHLVATAFDGHPLTIGPDLLTTYEELAEAVRKHPCKGLSVHQFAAQLASMLDRMILPRSHFMMRRLRYKAARMYLEAGDVDRALVQAKLAHDDHAVIAPMSALLAEIQLRKGNYSEAARLIDLAASKAAIDDTTGQQVIAGLRSRLRDELKMHVGNPHAPRNVGK